MKTQPQLFMFIKFFFFSNMSDIPEHLNKIKTSITELTANIEKLEKKTVNEDSNETGKQFKLVVGKTQKCQSMLNI